MSISVTCTKHPFYAGKTLPRLCPTCEAIYALRNFPEVSESRLTRVYFFRETLGRKRGDPS